jgi:hypothetical protein
MITQEQAEALALQIIEEQKAVAGCDSESAEEVESKRLAIVIKKVIDFVQPS